MGKERLPIICDPVELLQAQVQVLCARTGHGDIDRPGYCNVCKAYAPEAAAEQDYRRSIEVDGGAQDG